MIRKAIYFNIKTLFFLSVFPFLNGCRNSNDNLKELIGKVDYKSRVQTLFDKIIFTEPNKDSTSYKYFYKIGKDTLPVEVELNPDDYNFGKLRQIKIHLGGDSLYDWGVKTFYSRAFGPRLKKEIDTIYSQFVNWYGKPDSVIHPALMYLGKTNLGLQDSAMQSLGLHFAFPQDEKHNSLATKSEWYLKNFKIVFYRPRPEKDKYFNNAFTYLNAYILYEVNDYKKEIKQIKDSIRPILKPKDIITMYQFDRRWIDLNSYYNSGDDKRLEIDLSQFQRLDREEPRSVTAIKFNMVLKDKFGETLFTAKDLKYVPDEPIKAPQGDKYQQNISTKPITFSLNYNSQSETGRIFEYTRLHPETNAFHIEIKSVVFDDGQVLN